MPLSTTPGVLPDGTAFRGPAELKQVLRRQADAFRRNLSEKLLTYALGRGLEYYDAEAVAADRRQGPRERRPVVGVRHRRRRERSVRMDAPHPR